VINKSKQEESNRKSLIAALLKTEGLDERDKISGVIGEFVVRREDFETRKDAESVLDILWSCKHKQIPIPICS
jgi:hypothetical protein